MDSDYNSIEKIKSGNIDAFKIFFESFYPSLNFFTNKYIDDEEAAQDIVQDAFIYFWEKRMIFNSVSAAKVYLYKYVKNRSLNYLKHHKFQEKINDQHLESEIYFRDVIVEEETFQIITKAIESLAPREQQIMELVLDGLKNGEIAIQLGISINTIKTLKMRAYEKLRKELKDLSLLLFILCHKN